MEDKKMLNTRILIVSFALITAFLVLSNHLHAQVYQNPITFHEQNFENSLRSAVRPNVKGYQYVLIHNGVIVAEDAGGKAQNSDDFGGNGLNMTLDTPTNIGSLAKFLSGTAMLNLMEKPWNGEQWDPGKTLSQKLDRRFSTIVPNVWTTDLSHPWVDDITFRQLLRHRTGFDNDKPNNRTVFGFLKDSDGFDPIQYTAYNGNPLREYSNINFVLTGYLITFYRYPHAKVYLDSETEFLSEEDADQAIRDTAGDSMHLIMKDRIWDRMNPQIEPNCDAANELQNSAAYGYSSKNDSDPGFIFSEFETYGHCKGQGGYYMSARDLANYLAHFSATDLIVNSQTRNLMYNDSWTSDQDYERRLVWSSTSVHEWFANNFGMPRIVSSNGAQDDDFGNGYRNVIIRFPQNYYLVLLTNSPELDTGELKNAGVAAFRAGMEHNFN